jgi:hypothetical protein
MFTPPLFQRYIPANAEQHQPEKEAAHLELSGKGFFRTSTT